MTKIKFKVGEQVVFTKSKPGYFVKGQSYTINHIAFDSTTKPTKVQLIDAENSLIIIEYEVLVKDFFSSNLSTKETNPKDAVGVRKWRQFSCIPFLVLCEVGVAMLEGALKYGRHNYRVAGVRASIYIDAAQGHLTQFWEGEDLDPDTKLSHITKAITSLIVLRDSMIQDNWVDDRPPKAELDKVRDNLQSIVEEMLDKYPEPVEAFTEINKNNKR